MEDGGGDVVAYLVYTAHVSPPVHQLGSMI